jgi:hypothetical protein
LSVQRRPVETLRSVRENLPGLPLVIQAISRAGGLGILENFFLGKPAPRQESVDNYLAV